MSTPAGSPPRSSDTAGSQKVEFSVTTRRAAAPSNHISTTAASIPSCPPAPRASRTSHCFARSQTHATRAGALEGARSYWRRHARRARKEHGARARRELHSREPQRARARAEWERPRRGARREEAVRDREAVGGAERRLVSSGYDRPLDAGQRLQHRAARSRLVRR